jgi:hypothetical protein
MRYIIVLVIGLCAGYAYGFNDAQHHEKPIVTRIVERVGGKDRENFMNDADRKMNELQKR